MLALDVVIVGGGAGGMSAAASVRRESPDATITLYEKGDWISYAMCGLPYFIGGVTDDPGDLVTFTPSSFWEKRRVLVKTRHEVTEIDPDAKSITVKRADGSTFQHSYDRLILATGAASKARPYVRHAPGAFALHTMDDAIAIRQYLKDHKPQQALIVGSGYIGLEMADELNKQELEVTMWKGRSHFLGLDSDEIDAWISQEMKQHGVRLETGNRFERVEVREIPTAQQRAKTGADSEEPIHSHVITVYGQRERSEWPWDQERQGAFRPSGHSIPSDRVQPIVRNTDLLILAIGADPVSPPSLTRHRFQTAKNGALIVDRYLRVNLSDIWAVGDGVLAPHRFGPADYIALATTANRMGRIAGYNAVHTDTPIEFAGITGTMMTTAFGLDIARTGLSDEKARLAGYDPVAVTIKAPDRSRYFPDVKNLILRLSADRKSGRLLGAELAGPPGVGKRIDAVSVALFAGLSASDVKQLDLAYVPPRGTVWDPLLIAGHELEKKLKAPLPTA